MVESIWWGNFREYTYQFICIQEDWSCGGVLVTAQWWSKWCPITLRRSTRFMGLLLPCPFGPLIQGCKIQFWHISAHVLPQSRINDPPKRINHSKHRWNTCKLYWCTLVKHPSTTTSLFWTDAPPEYLSLQMACGLRKHLSMDYWPMAAQYT